MLTTWTLLPGVILHTIPTDDNAGFERSAVDFMTFPSVICMYPQLLKYTMNYHSDSNEWEWVRVRMRKREGWDKIFYVDIYLSINGWVHKRGSTSLNIAEVKTVLRYAFHAMAMFSCSTSRIDSNVAFIHCRIYTIFISIEVQYLMLIWIYFDMYIKYVLLNHRSCIIIRMGYLMSIDNVIFGSLESTSLTEVPSYRPNP